MLVGCGGGGGCKAGLYFDDGGDDREGGRIGDDGDGERGEERSERQVRRVGGDGVRERLTVRRGEVEVWSGVLVPGVGKGGGE